MTEITNISEGKKAYTFRRLQASDTFLMFKILSKIGVNEFTACLEKDSVKQLMSAASGEAESNSMSGISVMLEIANIILCNLPKCEAEIFQMLASVSNMTEEEIRGMEFVTFMQMVVDFVKKDEFADFIKVVSGLFKQEK